MASLGDWSTWSATLRRKLRGRRSPSPSPSRRSAEAGTDSTDGPERPGRQFTTPEEAKGVKRKETSYEDGSATLEALHNAQDGMALVKVLRKHRREINVNIIDFNLGLAPIHSIIRRKRKNRLQLLLGLLVHSNVDVNLIACDGNTPLHMIVQEKDNEPGVLDCTKALISFGAKVNITNAEGMTPLDLVVRTHPSLRTRQASLDASWLAVSIDVSLKARGSRQATASRQLSNATAERLELLEKESDMYKLLQSVGGLIAASPLKLTPDPTMEDEEEGVDETDEGTRVLEVPELSEVCGVGPPTIKQSVGATEREKLYHEGEQSRRYYKELEENLNVLTAGFESIRSFNETHAMIKQKEEISRFRRTGQRVLCLDGGGIKGLVQIEVLSQIEEATGEKITDLFDFIVGTSTGAIVALGMVYAGKSLSELRQLYFQLKEEVFANPKFGVAFNTQALESTLKAVFGTEMRMGDVTYPKVLVAAVNKEATPLQLHFFNNCFRDKFSNEYVWKVARCTSAAPVFFNECDNYVDGGVLANNPCQYGLDAIQNFYLHQGLKLPISVVVSVGTGVYPPEKLGRIDPLYFLLPGIHWLKFKNAFKATSNLLQLFSNALVESEMLTGPCRQLCLGQGIQFFRFSPQLDDVIPAGETDDGKLLQMLITTRKQTQVDMEKLIKYLV